MRGSKLRHATASWLIVAGLARIAVADDPPDAERLYDEGRALMTAGKPVEACAKFEQSLARDPRQVGVLMNLGLCNERAGKVATAVRLYREALDRASEANLTGVRAKAAAEIDRLAPEIPELRPVRVGPPAAGEKLVIDDVVIANDLAALALDPGRHSVVVTAPGRLPFETTISLERAERKELRLPILEAPRPVVVATGSSARRPAGKALALGGAAAMLAAGGLALYARHDYDGLFAGTAPRCGGTPSVNGRATCDAVGQSRSDRDHQLGTVAMVGGAVAIAVALTGAALWATAPGDARLVPTLTPTSAGVALGGAF